MTERANIPSLVKLTGVIEHYSVARSSASFVFTNDDRTALGVVAIAASLAGQAGQAISTASSITSTEEDADYVSFQVAGQRVRGWVWRSPFADGDIVDVIGESKVDHLELAAIVRPADRIIALYPHCSRGRSRHIWNAVKWWLLGSTLFLLAWISLLLLIGSTESFVRGLADGTGYVYFGMYVFFGLMAASLAYRWMPFVRVAERVFTALGWSNPGSVDLPKATKAHRKTGDPGELGTFYFRY